MPLKDDGLITPEVGNWNAEKYKLLQYYSDLFASSTRKRQNCRVYINLFSGAGRSKFRESGEIVESSAMLALRIPFPFDKYIFCDIDSQRMQALKQRIEREFPHTSVEYILGDVNGSAEEIKSKLPSHSKQYKVISFCFIDPFKMDNLAFETIQCLAERFMDFLILIPTDMDAHRNEANYFKDDNITVARFLGLLDWRKNWVKEKEKNIPFGQFILDMFSRQMANLNFLEAEPDETSILVKNTQKHARLYRLAFYSRHELGIKLFRSAKKYSTQQTSLFD